ncbi:MAG TPA: hypothetical protein DCL38_03780, partial [Lachnospiraceae bacterium]|nr:hypothetical protein [Lachnospiraceae bacterium]
MIRLIKKIAGLISDPSVDFRERVFTFFSIIGVLAAFIALIGDLIIGEGLPEIIVLILTIVFVPVITYYSVHYHKIDFGTRAVVLAIVFILMPVIFFFGGGVRGGGIIWICFSYLYTGLVLYGTWRTVMLIILGIITAIEYGAGYYYPELVYHHSDAMFYLDSCLSVYLVGLVIYYMVKFQNNLFTEENKRAREEMRKVEELNRAQNRFFSNMSHEIRTPINTILGINELFLRNPDLPPEMIADSRSIQGAGKMLLSIINDILDMSRIESGRMDIVPVSYNTGELLSDIVNMIWARAAEKGLAFHISVDPRTPSKLYGDEVRIKQILINLLNNAVKYTREGYVSLNLECDRTDNNRAWLTFTVTDSGTGIKKDAIPYLFDAFKRDSEEENRYIEGTGLGLSIVKQLVSLMGGQVSVNSVYTQGSVFTVRLPQEVSDDQDIGEVNLNGLQSSRDRIVYQPGFFAADASILIVDDNELNITVEKRLLSGTGLDIDTALSGAEALSKSLDRHYDLILMDHLMPGMNGIECLKKLKNQQGGFNRATPVIILTANTGGENLRLYMNSGFSEALLKPVSGKELEEAVLRYLPPDKVHLNEANELIGEGFRTSADYVRREGIAITTDSMCDLSGQIIKELGIGVMPYRIYTEKGMFHDDEADPDGVIRYLDQGDINIRSEAPSEKEYELFFAEQLTKARYVIHISPAKNITMGYEKALSASHSFDNVIVIDSGHMSSGTSLVAIGALMLVRENRRLDEILKGIQDLTERVNTFFILDDTEILARHGRLSVPVHYLCRAMMLHPLFTMKDSRFKTFSVGIGATSSCMESLIRKVLGKPELIDPDIIFITHVGLSESRLKEIRSLILQCISFRHVVFQEASASTSINCGPGSLGLFFLKRGESKGRMGDLLPNDEEQAGSDPVPIYKETAERIQKEGFSEDKPTQPEAEADRTSVPAEELPWYEGIKGIEGDAGIANCGSEEDYRTVLKLFYDSLDEKTEELESLLSEDDIKNYTIKVHALKSSSKLIGAGELALFSAEMEEAGHKNDAGHIRAHHGELLLLCKGLRESLAGVFGDEPVSAGGED